MPRRIPMDEVGRPYFAAESVEEASSLRRLRMSPVKINPAPWEPGEHRPFPIALLALLLALAGLLSGYPAHAEGAWTWETQAATAYTDTFSRIPAKYREATTKIELGALCDYDRYSHPENACASSKPLPAAPAVSSPKS